MEKKYKLTDETINLHGITLYRIEALKDFNNVKKGDKGGFVESELNLSQKGNCWIYDDACVYDGGRVEGDAYVFDNAQVFNNAHIYEDAQVDGDAKVCCNAKVCGTAWVYDNARVSGNACVCGAARVYGDAYVSDNAQIYGDAFVYENARIYDNAQVYGDTCVYGNAIICKDAEIGSNEDYIVFKNWWSSWRYFTWTRSNDMWSVGCFYGTGEELIKKAYKDSELSGREYERIVKYVDEIKKDNGK